MFFRTWPDPSVIDWVLAAGEEMSLQVKRPRGILKPSLCSFLRLVVSHHRTVEMGVPRTFYRTCAKGWSHVKEIHKLPGLLGFTGGSVVSWGHQESDTTERLSTHTSQGY